MRISLFVLFLATTARAEDSPPFPVNALALPLVSQQTSYSCGAASLLSVLYYWGAFDGDERDLYSPLHTTHDGTEPEPMARHARKLGLEARYAFDASVEDLTRALAAGETVILSVQAWSHGKKDLARDWDDGHYIVLIALDAQRAFAMDPSVRGGYAWLTVDELLTRWHDVERVHGRDVHRQHMAIFIHGKSPARRPPAHIE